MTLDSAIGTLASARALEPGGRILAGLTERRDGRIVALARGGPLGHPAHPAVTDLPIGFWTSAWLLDLVGGSAAASASRRLIGWGVVSAIPAIVTGVADVPRLPDAKRRVAVVHAAANAVATAGFAGSWMLRRRGHHALGIAAGFAAGTVATIGGALGGWMAHAPGTPSRESLARQVAERLDGRRVATAESCTAGRVAMSLASVERAAEFLRGGMVAYQDSTKRAQLGLDVESAFTSEAAAQMAVGACRLFGVEAAVATTGVAGDDAEDGVPPGTVFVATAVDGDVSVGRYRFTGSPADVCDQACDQALRDLAGALFDERGDREQRSHQPKDEGSP